MADGDRSHEIKRCLLLGRKVMTKLAAAAAAAKSLQSCQTLCDAIDGSPSGSSVHGIFQARVLEWGAIALTRWSFVGKVMSLLLNMLSRLVIAFLQEASVL